MKFLYPIKKLNIKPWIKYWVLKKTSGSKVLSDLIEGTSPITIENVYEGTTLQELAFKGQTNQNRIVKGDNYININNGRYRVDLGGKNLLNIKDNLRDSASNGITAVYNNDNSITISGQATSNYAYLSNAINCTLPIGTYTLSIDKKLPYRIYINCKYTDNTSGNYIIETNTLTKTFTTSKIIQTVTLIISDIVSGTTYNETIYFQLEEGSQPTEFSPYVANPIELGENDKIWNDEGVWKLNNNEITVTNLIEQLEAIKNATLISGTNEITQMPADLPFILNFKYYMKG